MLIGTSPNLNEFVGFKSSHSITQVVIDTTGGAVQNEGIDGIWVIKDLPLLPMRMDHMQEPWDRL